MQPPNIVKQYKKRVTKIEYIFYPFLGMLPAFPKIANDWLYLGNFVYFKGIFWCCWATFGGKLAERMGFEPMCQVTLTI
jgi:hypothetical protein